MITKLGKDIVLTKFAGIIETLSKDELLSLRRLYSVQAKADKIYSSIQSKSITNTQEDNKLDLEKPIIGTPTSHKLNKGNKKMITKQAEDYLEKEAFLGTLASFGAKAAKGVGNTFIANGQGIKALPQAMHNAPAAMRSGVASVKGSFATGKGVRESLKAVKAPIKERLGNEINAQGKAGLRSLARTAKYTAGIGGGAYLGNKFYNMGKPQAQPDPHYQQYYK